MPEHVLFAVNKTHEGPGVFPGILDERNLTYDIVNLDTGTAFPDPTAYKAVVVLGGPDSANDATPKMTQEVEQVQRVLSSGIPYLGVCLGLQVGVKAAGGEVVVNPVREIGFFDPDGEYFNIGLDCNYKRG